VWQVQLDLLVPQALQAFKEKEALPVLQEQPAQLVQPEQQELPALRE
jgi:hypothetical protein